MSEEFSRRVDVRIIKDEPLSLEDWQERHGIDCVTDAAAAPCPRCGTMHADYIEKFQPYRFHAKGMNFEIVSHGESYKHEAGAINAVELLFGDDTTCYWAREYGEDRGLNLLRYGKTDRSHQEQP